MAETTLNADFEIALVIASKIPTWLDSQKKAPAVGSNLTITKIQQAPSVTAPRIMVFLYKINRRDTPGQATNTHPTA